MSLGNFFVGNDGAGRKLADKAKTFETKCKLSHLPAVACTEMLLALISQWDERKVDAVHYLKRAENACEDLCELKGCVKVVSLWLRPVSTCFEDFEYFQFAENELQMFPPETKIVYNWTVQYIYNVFLSGQSWPGASDCYCNLLLA